QARQHARFRSGGDDDVLRLDDLAGDFNLPGALERRPALDPFDLVLLHQELNALSVLRDDAVLAIDDLRVIEAWILALDAVLLRMQKVLPDVGGMEQRLGRDAAHVEAGPAELGILLDDRSLQPVLARAHRRRVA